MKKIILTLLLALVGFIALGQNHSVNFDGTDDYVELGGNFNFDNTDQFTVEAWIKTGTNGFSQIVSRLDTQFRGWGLQVSDGGVLSGYLFSTFLSNQRYVEGTTILIDDTWHHVAMVFNGDNIALYVDGNLELLTVDESLGDLDTIANNGKTHIGNYEGEGSPGEYFNGNIDEVRIWNNARSLTEIGDNYATELSGTETNLIGYYKMDNLDAVCDIEDCSVSAAHGTREGVGGANNTAQYTTEVPTITDVACGDGLGCTLSSDDFASLDFVIYPNPAAQNITIAGFEEEISEVTVVNVLGEVVKEINPDAKQINISQLPQGLYFMTVTTNNKRGTVKIIKK